MKATQHTAEQSIKILEPAEKGDQTIGAVCRTHGIAENTLYRWRKRMSKNYFIIYGVLLVFSA